MWGDWGGSNRRPLGDAAVVLALLAALSVTGCQPSGLDWRYGWTGEERPLSQLRAAAQLTTDWLRPRPRLAPESVIQHAGVNPFGVNVFLEQEVEEWKRERTVAMVAEAGFHWLRQEFPWEDIEIHAKGDFEDRRHEPHRSAWEKYDSIVALTEGYGLELIVRLSNPPAWARADGDARGSFAPPDRLSDWGDYVYAVVSRYRGRVHYYQLWNEPNIYPEWGEQPVDPAAYTRLLCEGYRRAKEADPQVVILSGALAPTVSLHPGPGPALGLNEFVFLQRMYDAGAAACFDILAVNDYLLWSGPTDRRLEPLTINFSRPLYIRDIMVANGDAHKPIWISEMNSNAVPDDPSIQGWGVYGQVTLEQQARYAVQAYQRVIEEWPWAGVVSVWFFRRPSDAERNQAWYYFRMVEPDFTPLPVYTALRDFAVRVEPTLLPGIHLPDHWGLRYAGATPDGGAGAWSDEEGFRRTSAPGATLSFTFEGASLTLMPGPAAGVIEVSLDGAPARRVALDGRPVELARTGGRARHTVTLRLVEGTLSVAQVRVSAPRGVAPPVAAAAAGVSVVLVAWAAARRRMARCRGQPARSLR